MFTLTSHSARTWTAALALVVAGAVVAASLALGTTEEAGEQAASPTVAPGGTNAPGATPTPATASLTGDSALDAIVESLLEDDATTLAARFRGTAARLGYVVGGPVGLYDVRLLDTETWTRRLADSDRTLEAVALPVEPGNPPPVRGPAAVDAVPLYEGERDYDIVLLAQSAEVPEHAWRFSVQDGRVVDVIVENLDTSGERRLVLSLPRRLALLLPSPDTQRDRFLVLPPEALWPPPERAPQTGPLPTTTAEPSVAPVVKTGDDALDATIEALLTEDAAGLTRRFGDIPGRLQICVPDPYQGGACSIDYARISARDWIARFAASDRLLYGVTTGDPAGVIVAGDTGADVADAWRFGVRGDALLEVDLIEGGPPPPLPPGARPADDVFWSNLYSFALDPTHDYQRYRVLPPQELLPEPPPNQPLSVRTGDSGVDAVLGRIEARDAAGLIDALAPGDIRVRACRGPEAVWGASMLDEWARDTVDRAIGIYAVVNAPEGYDATARHVIVLVTQINPLWWDSTAILERDGQIVGLVAGGQCPASFLVPGERSYLIPPLDPGLGVFDSSRRSGLAYVDRVLDALQSSDAEAWYGLIDYQPVPCEVNDYGPACPPGAAAGTPVDAVPSVGCHGGYLTRDNPPRPSLGPEQEVYTVVGPSEDGFVSIVLYDANVGASTISVGPNGVRGFARGCGQFHPEWLIVGGEPDYLLAPP